MIYRVHEAYNKLTAILLWHKEQGHHTRFKVPVDRALKAINEAQTGAPVKPLERDREDFPDQHGPSEIRKKLNSFPQRVTRTSMQRNMAKNPDWERKQREARGIANISLTETTLNSIMQQQFIRDREPL